MHIPVILLVVGRQYTLSPETTNISLAIPFYAGATDALLLFKDDKNGRIFVIAAKGAFAAFSANNDEDYSTQWASLRTFESEDVFMKECALHDISVVRSEDRRVTKGISLGETYSKATGCLVDIESLLQQPQIGLADMEQLLADEAMNHLAIYCKTSGKLKLLRSLLLRHKREEIVVRLEDRHGAGIVIKYLQKEDITEEQKRCLRNRLREAHTANRSVYQGLLASRSKEAQEASAINRAIDSALVRIASLEKASYTADILSRKSNRAMRAERADAAESQIHILALDLSDHVSAYRGECPICCADNVVLSVVLKQFDQSTMEENTTNFALDFPLAAGLRNIDMMSSQCICFQCAVLCGKSIYNEDLAAILPTVKYTGANKRYMDHQLCLAITGGLKTGTAGIAQMFISMLDRVLTTKSWCQVGPENSVPDRERLLRRNVFGWMLNSMITHAITRETFSEEGAWVYLPQAMLWALDEFKEVCLDSWLIQYPIGGFRQFIRILDRLSQYDHWFERQNLGLGHQIAASPNRLLVREDTLYRMVAVVEAKVM